jgi:hypothetical protein
MLSIANTVAVAFCTVLMALLINVGHVVHQKIELQNTADAVAYSGALWQARGMNAITGTNHVIGEMLAFVVLHEAIGGTRLDNPSDGPADTQEIDHRLDAAHYEAEALGASTPAYDTVREQGGVFADRTLLRSKEELKKRLRDIYCQKVTARVLQMFFETAAEGRALEALMDIEELKVLQEYKTLNLFQGLARSLVALKQLLRDVILPATKSYTDEIVAQVPTIAAQAANDIAQRNGCAGSLYPLLPLLPVVLDPFAAAQIPNISDENRLPGERLLPEPDAERATNLRKQVVKTSQLCRATFPWVNYHREALIKVLRSVVPLSEAAKFYYEETTDACIHLCDELQVSGSHNLGLYVLKGYPAPDKGYELWADGHPKYADQLFSVAGLAYRQAPIVLGQPGFFRQAHPQGRAALAQAFLYNGNREQRNFFYIDLDIKRLAPEHQADVGWDTLNWKEGSRPFELVATKTTPDFPPIQLNWQAKLVPLSGNRLGQIQQSTELPAEFRQITQKLLSPMPQSLRTH